MPWSAAVLSVLAVAAVLLLPLEKALAVTLLGMTVSDRFVPPAISVAGLEVRVGDLALAALLLRMALLRRRNTEPAVAFPTAALPLAVLIWLALLSSTLSAPRWSVSEAASVMTATARLGWSALILPMAYTVAKGRGIVETARGLLLVADAQAAMVFAEVISFSAGARWSQHFEYSLGPIATIRPVGLASDPGVVVHVLAPFVLFVWARLLLETRGPGVIVDAARLFAYGTGALMTLSRGPLLGLVTGAATVAVASGMVLQAAVVGTVFLLLAMPVLAPALRRLAGSLWALAGGTGWGGFTSEGQRLTTWGLAWRGFEASPVTGLGWSGFRIWVRTLPELGRLFGTSHERALNSFTGTAYNQYLQLLADLGPLGLITYLLALASTASEALRTRALSVEPAEKAAGVAVLGYVAFLFVAGLTDTWLSSGSAASATFFAVCGIGFAGASTYRGHRPAVGQSRDG
jgi:hypothetical protein